MMTCLLRLLLLLAAVTLSACALPQQELTLLSPLSTPTEIELLDLMKRRDNGISTLQGRMASKVVNLSGKRSSTQLAIIKKPSSLRLDALTPFGHPALTMSADGENVSLYYHSKKRFFRGPADSYNLSKILPSMLGIDGLALILTGGVPLIDFESASVEIDGYRYRLTLDREGAREEVFFDGATLDPLQALFYDGAGGIKMNISMGDYREVEGIRFPMAVRATMPSENYSMDVKYSDVALNGDIESASFAFSPPEGIAVEDIESLRF